MMKKNDHFTLHKFGYCFKLLVKNRGICRCYRNICARPMRLRKTVSELACMTRFFITVVHVPTRLHEKEFDH